MNSTQPTVLVTGVSGDMGLGIIDGLRMSEDPIPIVGIDMNADNVGFTLCDDSEIAPPVASEAYPDFLLGLARRYDSSILMTGIDSELPAIVSYRAQLAAEGCTLIAAEENIVHTFSDKLETVRWFEAQGLLAPRTLAVEGDTTVHDLLAELTLPLIFKTRKGHGSKGVHVVRSVDELTDLLKGDEPALAQEYIEGPEYTIATVFDDAGTLRDSLIMERRLVGGRTISARVEANPAIDSLINDFATKVDAFGPINLQLRVTPDGRPLVFEVNARFSGSTGMRVALGYNEPLRVYRHIATQAPIPRQPIACGTRVYRRWSHVVTTSEQQERTERTP